MDAFLFLEILYLQVLTSLLLVGGITEASLQSCSFGEACTFLEVLDLPAHDAKVFSHPYQSTEVFLVLQNIRKAFFSLFSSLARKEG